MFDGHSTQETIIENAQQLVAFAEGLAELYDYDREGEDYWTSYELLDGSVVDVNVYIFCYYDEEYLTITAYPVDGSGQTKTTHGVTLFKKNLDPQKQ